LEQRDGSLAVLENPRQRLGRGTQPPLVITPQIAAAAPVREIARLLLRQRHHLVEGRRVAASSPHRGDRDGYGLGKLHLATRQRGLSQGPQHVPSPAVVGMRGYDGKEGAERTVAIQCV